MPLGEIKIGPSLFIGLVWRLKHVERISRSNNLPAQTVLGSDPLHRHWKDGLQ